MRNKDEGEETGGRGAEASTNSAEEDFEEDCKSSEDVEGRSTDDVEDEEEEEKTPGAVDSSLSAFSSKTEKEEETADDDDEAFLSSASSVVSAISLESRASLRPLSGRGLEESTRSEASPGGSEKLEGGEAETLLLGATAADLFSPFEEMKTPRSAEEEEQREDC